MQDIHICIINLMTKLYWYFVELTLIVNYFFLAYWLLNPWTQNKEFINIFPSIVFEKLGKVKMKSHAVNSFSLLPTDEFRFLKETEKVYVFWLNLAVSWDLFRFIRQERFFSEHVFEWSLSTCSVRSFNLIDSSAKQDPKTQSQQTSCGESKWEVDHPERMQLPLYQRPNYPSVFLQIWCQKSIWSP